MSLSDRVRTRREELSLSQEELARRMGYKSRTSINKIECGREVSQKVIMRLADALGVTPAYLMGWVEELPDEKKPAISDGLTENQRKLIEFAKNVPEDKAEMILRVIQSIVEAD